MAIDELIHLYRDNKVTTNFTNNFVLHDCTKHVEVDRHFIRENIDSKELILPYIKFEDQLVAMFTKELSCGAFEKNINTFKMFDMYAQLDDDC